MGHLKRLVSQNGDPGVHSGYDVVTDLDAMRQAMSRIARFTTNGAAPPSTKPADSDPLLSRAIEIYRLRRRREVIFGDFFADAAWDILLDLFIAQRSGKTISVTAACVGAAVPSTTALRTIGLLSDAGVIVRKADPHDGRRVYVSLSPSAVEQMEALLT